MRLFAAISLSPAVRHALLQTMEQLRGEAQRGRFTHGENLHLTLAFVGETERVDAARAALHRVEADRFPLTLDGSGQFGAIWWVGVKDNPALTNVAKQVQNQLRSAGFVLEDHPFVPHITLARRVMIKEPVPLNVPPISMTVEGISLMRSHRVKNRLVYTEIDRIELK